MLPSVLTKYMLMALLVPGFFGGIRIPATFLAGSSLAAIFTLKSAAASLSNDNGKLSKIERRAIKFYHLVSVMAFLLSLNTIILATSAYTSILHGRFDQLAETAYLMMKREFEYEASYICIDCRISHNTILTCSFLVLTVHSRSVVFLNFHVLLPRDDHKPSID